MLEARGFVEEIDTARKILEANSAVFKGEYRCRDIIFSQRNPDKSLNDEFLRLRLNLKNIWGEADIVVVIKKTEFKEVGKNSKVSFKQGFKSETEARKFIKENYSDRFNYDFEFTRIGWQYDLGDDQIDLEKVEDLKNVYTIEVKSNTEEGLKRLLNLLNISSVIRGSTVAEMEKLISDRAQANEARNIKYYVKLLSVPILFLIIYSTMFFSWGIFNFPAPEELVLLVRGWFDEYGFPALLLSSFLEGIMLIGAYFPGLIVIFLGVLVSETPVEAVTAVSVSTVGLITAHIFNYFLGRYGWYKILVKLGAKSAIERSKDRLEKKGAVAIPLSYWLPSIGALTNTAAGIIRFPFRKFLAYSVLSSIFWYSTVGLVVYLIGDSALSVATGGGKGTLIVYLVIVVWIAILLISDHRERKQT